MQHKGCPMIVEKMAGCNDVGQDAAQRSANSQRQGHCSGVLLHRRRGNGRIVVQGAASGRWAAHSV